MLGREGRQNAAVPRTSFHASWPQNSSSPSAWLISAPMLKRSKDTHVAAVRARGEAGAELGTDAPVAAVCARGALASAIVCHRVLAPCTMERILPPRD